MHSMHLCGLCCSCPSPGEQQTPFPVEQQLCPVPGGELSTGCTNLHQDAALESLSHTCLRQHQLPSQTCVQGWLLSSDINTHSSSSGPWLQCLFWGVWRLTHRLPKTENPPIKTECPTSDQNYSLHPSFCFKAILSTAPHKYFSINLCSFHFLYLQFNTDLCCAIP